jgi:hypothetical protein
MILMNSRIQGTACLTLGVFGLAFYLILNSAPAGSGGQYVPQPLSSGPLLEPLQPDSWQTTYWGETLKEDSRGFEQTAWTITLYGLPKDHLNQRTIVVHAEGNPLEETEWGQPAPERRDAFLLFDVSGEGVLKPQFVPGNLDLVEFPIDLLVLADRAHAGDVTSVAGSTITHFPNGEICDASDDSVASRFANGQRRIEVTRNEKDGRLEKFNAVGRWYGRKSDSRTQVQLHWGYSSQIPCDRAIRLSNDLVTWHKINDRVRRIVKQASVVSDYLPQQISQDLSDHAFRASSETQLFIEPMVQKGFRSFAASPGAVLSRLALGATRLQELCTMPELRWETTDAEGCVRMASDSLGKVTVMGFVFRGQGETQQAIQTMLEIRSNFSDYDVDVLAFTTDLKDEDREVLIPSLKDLLPVYHGNGIAEQLNLFTCGVPLLLVVDRQGKPRILHACQHQSVTEVLQAQLQELIEESEAPAELHQVNSTTFTSRTIDGLDHLDADATLPSVN